MSDIYRGEQERAQKKKIITIFIAIYLIAIFTVIILLTSTLSYDKVYAGVTLNGQDVSGMTREELTNMINNKYNEQLGNSFIYFTYNNGETTVGSISLKDLSIKYNTEEIVNALYTPGHEGSMIERLKEILKLSREKKDISMFEADSNGHTLAEYDDGILRAKIGEVVGNIGVGVIEHNFVKEEQNKILKIITGRSGIEVDREKLKTAILDAAGSMNSTNIPLEGVSEITNPKPFDVNTVYDTYNKQAKNATYQWKDSAKTDFIIVPEVRGETLNIADLVSVSQTIDSANAQSVYQVPMTFTEPTIKASSLSEPKFDEVIGKGSTSFSSSSAGRKANIIKATELINGYILLPGETFSFNDHVGDTTPDKGFQLARGYENGDVVDTYGGGVCQVSTTLYNALINGGLEITKRSSHSMTVSYVPKGMDAAVAFWGGKDIAFKNNLDVPIKIVGTISGSTLTFEIKGINKNKNTKYTYSASKTDSFTENGKKYEIYTTYRTITVNGTITENKKVFNTSKYLIS